MEGNPSISNGKVSKNGSVGANGDAKETIRLEEIDKSNSTSVHQNGLNNNEKVNGIDT